MALTPTTKDPPVPGEPVPGRAAVAEEPEARRERPVFADAAGRRRVRFRTLAQGLCAIAAVWLGALLLGLLGSGSLPGLPRIAGGGGDDVQALEATGSDSAAPERAAAGSRSSNEVANAVGAAGAALSHEHTAATGGAGLEPSDSGSERRSGYRGDFTTLGLAIEQGHDDAARTNRRSDLRHRSSAPPQHPRGGGRREAPGILVGPQPRGGPHARAIEAPSEAQRRQQLKPVVKQRRQELKQAVKQRRQELKQTVKQRRQQLKPVVKQRLKQTVKQRRQQLRPVVKQQRQQLKPVVKQQLKQTVKQRRQQLRPVVKLQPRQLPPASSPARPQPKIKKHTAPPVAPPAAPKPKQRPAPPRPAAAPPPPVAETPGAGGRAKAGARRGGSKATPSSGG